MVGCDVGELLTSGVRHIFYTVKNKYTPCCERLIEICLISKSHLLNLDSDGFLRLAFGVEFPEHNFEFLFL